MASHFAAESDENDQHVQEPGERIFGESDESTDFARVASDNGTMNFDLEAEGMPKTVWFAVFASLVWLAAAAAVIYLLVSGGAAARVTLTEWAGIAAGVAAPLTAIWLVALVIARIDPARGRTMLARLEAAEAQFDDNAAKIRTRVEGIDNLLLAVASRLDNLGAVLDERGQGFEQATIRAGEAATRLSANLDADRAALDEAADRLLERGDAARSAYGEIVRLLPDAEAQAARIGATLEAHGAAAETRLREIETVIQTVEARSEAAAERTAHASAELGRALDHIDTTLRETEGLMNERAMTLSEHVDAALTDTANTLETVRSGLGEQAAAIGAAIEAANTSLEQAGRGAASAIDERLRTLVGYADALSDRFAAHEESSRNLLNTAENGFEVLEAKLSHATRSGSSMLEAFAERLRDVRGLIDMLAAPLNETRSLTENLQRDTASVADQLDESLTALNTRVPAEVAESKSRLQAFRGEVDALEKDLARVRQNADTLSTPVDELRGSLGTAARDVEEQRIALERTVADLTEQLGAAKTMLIETQQTAEGTALGASTQLIEALGRVREVAQQAAGTVKETLSHVVDDAVQALASATEEAVRGNMLKPVEDQITAIEAVGQRSADAAQASAERLSRSLVSVAETAAAVEARVAEANAALDTAERSDLSHQSNLLIEALNSASIDITKGLSTEVTEAAWKQYLAGDRSVFTRRAARLVTSTDIRAIVKHYDDEPEFRDAVRRYIHDFEAMLRRVMQDREGNALSVALLSSDVGKLYVALAQATERLRKESG